MKTEGGLTPKQERFVQEYLVDLNGAAAYRRAGYEAKGHAAETGAERLLRKAEVRARVREAQEERAARVEVRQDEVLEELLLILRSDVRHFTVGPNGELQLADGVPAAAGRAVASIKRKTARWGEDGESTETEIRLWPKDTMIELAGRHLGLFPNKLTVEDPQEHLAKLLRIPREALPPRREGG